MRTPRFWRSRLWHSRLWQSRLWQSLPYDGQGLFPSPTGVFADLRQSAAAVFWRRVPWWSRPLLIPLARLAWLVACAGHVWSYPPGRTLRLFLDCLQSGARPNEAWIWRQFFSPPGVHPLPGRAAGRFLSTLGAAAEHSLLSDKLATGEMLRRAGLAVPTLLGVIRPGTGLPADAPAWTHPGQLFIKPRHGSGGRGARVIQDAASLPADVSRDTLVQPLLSGPVLRLTTARNPGQAPFLHSAFLAFDVPGENPRNFIRGQIRVPVHPRTALMGAGIWFLHPGIDYVALPWNKAPLAGGPVPDFLRAAEMALQAMVLLPGLPLVNWDLMLTPEGPVILEGNTCGDWILTNLSALQELDTPRLEPLLRRWAAASAETAS